MRVLRDPPSIQAAIDHGLDLPIARLLRSHLEFVAEYDEADSGGAFSVVLVQPGDTLDTINAALRDQLLINHFSGKRYREPGFLPCFETLEEHPTFFEMFFIDGEDGTSVLIPKGVGIDPELLAICVQHATPAKEPSS